MEVSTEDVEQAKNGVKKLGGAVLVGNVALDREEGDRTHTEHKGGHTHRAKGGHTHRAQRRCERGYSDRYSGHEGD